MKKDKFNSFDKNNQGRIKPYCRSCDRGKCIKCEVEKQRDEFAKSDKICKECREKAKLEPWFVSRFCFGTDNFGRTERLKYGQGPTDRDLDSFSLAKSMEEYLYMDRARHGRS